MHGPDNDDHPPDLRGRLAAAERARDEAIAARARDRRDARHELRNMLGVIRSLARRSADGAAGVEQYRALLDGRLAAYFGVQSAAAIAPERGIDLAGLVGDQLLRFGLRVDEHVAMSGAPVRLSPRAAGLLALVLHEIAADYVASGRAEGPGRPRVGWEDGGDALTVEWREDARTGAPMAEHSRAWLDWLDQAISYELDGRAEAASTGGPVRYSITLPAACRFKAPAPRS